MARLSGHRQAVVMDWARSARRGGTGNANELKHINDIASSSARGAVAAAVTNAAFKGAANNQ